jgi:hypothetical protein
MIKLLYKPFGLLLSALTAAAAGKLSKIVWAKLSTKKALPAPRMRIASGVRSPRPPQWRERSSAGRRPSSTERAPKHAPRRPAPGRGRAP